MRIWYGPAFLLSAIFSILSPYDGYAQQISVSNVSFSMADSNVVIRYFLNGPVNRKYKVRLVLRRKSDPSFKFEPFDVSGAVGKGEFAGKENRIVWRLYDEFPYGLPGDDYYFQVTSTLVKKGGGASWLYLVGGAVVLGGAAAYYMTEGGLRGNSQPFPSPPDRP